MHILHFIACQFLCLQQHDAVREKITWVLQHNTVYLHSDTQFYKPPHILQEYIHKDIWWEWMSEVEGRKRSGIKMEKYTAYGKKKKSSQYKSPHSKFPKPLLLIPFGKFSFFLVIWKGVFTIPAPHTLFSIYFNSLLYAKSPYIYISNKILLYYLIFSPPTARFYY